jgi:hypothetical protein
MVQLGLKIVEVTQHFKSAAGKPLWAQVFISENVSINVDIYNMNALLLPV